MLSWLAIVVVLAVLVPATVHSDRRFHSHLANRPRPRDQVGRRDP